MNIKSFFANNKRLLIIIGSIVLGVLALYVGFAAYVSSLDAAFPNTYIDDVDVSGKNESEIIDILKNASDREYDAVSFKVTVGEISKTILASDLNVQIDINSAVELALADSKNGNFFTKPFSYIGSLFSDNVITTPVMVDEELVEHLATEFSEANVEPVDAAYIIEGDKMTLTPPVDGMVLNHKTFVDTLCNKFATFSYEDVTIELEHAEAKPLNLDEVYAEVHKEVADAKLEEIDGKQVVTPHVVGTDFDLDAAKEALEASPDKEVVIPLTLVQPKVTTLMIQSTLFQDTLSSKTTTFNSYKTNRVNNVKLAARAINGTILNPGEVFSYNKTVGPRTAARGYKPAGIFSGGEVVDGLGGGICQVSSTLYMATLYADLKTVERKNHSFYVDYAPKGQDATVVYGSIDFKFENNTQYPIKIVASATNSSITVTIKGTKTQNKTVRIQTVTLGTSGYTTKTVVDNTLQPGQQVVKQAGQNGITMDVYRYVYDANGNLISKTYENKSRYVPMTRIVHVGPSAEDAAATTTPADGTAPTPDTTTPSTGNTTPAPDTTTPSTGDTTPAPDVTTPSTGDTTPAPDTTTPSTGDTTPAPDVTTPSTGDTTPAPDTTTPSTGDTTPAPDETPKVTPPVESTPETPPVNDAPAESSGESTPSNSESPSTTSEE